MNSQGTGFVISSGEGSFVVSDAESLVLVDDVVMTPAGNRGLAVSFLTRAGESLYKCRDSGVVLESSTEVLKAVLGLEWLMKTHEDTIEIPSGKLIIVPWDLIKDVKGFWQGAPFFRVVLGLNEPARMGVCLQSSGSLRLRHGSLQGPVFMSTTLPVKQQFTEPVKECPPVQEPLKTLTAKLHTVSFTDVTGAWKFNPHFLTGKAVLRVILPDEVPDAVAVQFIRTRVSELLPGTSLQDLLLPDVLDTILKPKPGCPNVFSGVAGVVTSCDSGADGAILQIEYDTQPITLSNTKQDRSLIGKVYEA